MVAHFKDENRIIITGADRAESLLISQIVGNQEHSNITLKEFYDIDGEVNGFSIEIEDKQPEEAVQSVPSEGE